MMTQGRQSRQHDAGPTTSSSQCWAERIANWTPDRQHCQPDAGLTPSPARYQADSLASTMPGQHHQTASLWQSFSLIKKCIKLCSDADWFKRNVNFERFLSTYFEKIVLDHDRLPNQDQLHFIYHCNSRQIHSRFMIPSDSKWSKGFHSLPGQLFEKWKWFFFEILVCAKHAETEKHLTPKSIQPESILPPLSSTASHGYNRPRAIVLKKLLLPGP
jgi:hypothetical protein